MAKNENVAMNIGKTPHDRKLRQLITVPAYNLADKMAVSYNHIYIKTYLYIFSNALVFICSLSNIFFGSCQKIYNYAIGTILILDEIRILAPFRHIQ